MHTKVTGKNLHSTDTSDWTCIWCLIPTHVAFSYLHILCSWECTQKLPVRIYIAPTLQIERVSGVWYRHILLHSITYTFFAHENAHKLQVRIFVARTVQIERVYGVSYQHMVHSITYKILNLLQCLRVIIDVMSNLCICITTS